MSELSRIANDIDKRKNLEINLPKYMNTMISSYHRYSYIHLALNYYTWGALFTEERELPDSIKDLADRLNKIIREQVLEGFLPDRLEAGIESVDRIRTEIMKNMQTLTSYTDYFQIYEYVLNRLEYRFNDAEFPSGYSDEDFVGQITEYILSDRDNAVVHTKISEIVGQLPLRMTRQRYFEIVKESFSLYLGEEKGNLEELVYMLRTCGALMPPEETEGEWTDLYAVYTSMKQADFQNITETECKKLQDQLIFAADYIERMSNLYIIMQEVVNDVYIILLSMPYALTETGETENCRSVIHYVLERVESRKADAFEDENLDEIMDSFEKLEGKQERLYELFSENDYLLDSMDDLEDMMKSIMVDKLYLSLKQMAKLSSSSMFIELHEERNREPVDEVCLEQAVSKFMEEMETSFKENPKVVNRARMASTLQSLPAFFRNMEECREYLEQSLMNCSDEREKLASVELIQELMEL